MHNETKIVELEQKIRLLQMRWERTIPGEQEWNRIHQVSTSLTRSIEDQKMTKLALKTSQEQLSHEIAAHGEQWNSIQQEKRIKAIGQQYKTFTSEERVYHEVSITHVDAQGIHLNHRDGKARVTVEHLSDEQIVYFGLDRTEALQSKQEELKQQVAFDQWVERGIQKNRETELSPPLIDHTQNDNITKSSLAQEFSKTSPLRSPKTQNRTIYRVRNQGRPNYYSVYPFYYNSCTGQTLYYYRSYR